MSWLPVNEQALSAELDTKGVSQKSYDLIFQECPRFGELAKRERDRSIVLSEAFDSTLESEQIVNALVELGLNTPPEEIPWKRLLELAERSNTSEFVAVRAVIAAGKALCCTPRPRELERWLFRQMRLFPNSHQARSAIVVLGVSRIARAATLREWARLLRNPDTSDDTCRCIGKYASAWGMVYEGGTLDEGANCLLAGYDEVSASPERKLLIWKALGTVLDMASLGDLFENAELGVIRVSHIEDTTLWWMHELALREFADERNPERLRIKVTVALKPVEAISEKAFSAAKKILKEKGGADRLRSVAQRVIARAEKYGIEK